MTEQRIITFVPAGQYEAAFLGVHLVGAVRDRIGRSADLAGEWIFFLCENGHGCQPLNWRGARDVEAAKRALLRHAADWYDAAHTPLVAGQGERLAREARVG